MSTPKSIELNTPFKLSLILANYTTKPLQLTLDKEIARSIQFIPNWYCDGILLVDKTFDPNDMEHNYYSLVLEPKDSLTFDLVAEVTSYSGGDSLILKIDNYDEEFKLAKPKCDDFNLELGGMWHPGNGPFGDAMEGYSFRSKVEIVGY